MCRDSRWLWATAVVLALSASVARAQMPNPLIDLLAVAAPENETAAPADHLMASACLAELRAAYPDERHDFSDFAFTHSRVLGEVVRIDYRVTGAPDKPEANSSILNRLVCFRRPNEEALEMHTIRGSASDPTATGPIRIVPGPSQR